MVVRSNLWTKKYAKNTLSTNRTKPVRRTTAAPQRSCVYDYTSTWKWHFRRCHICVFMQTVKMQPSEICHVILPTSSSIYDTQRHDKWHACGVALAQWSLVILRLQGWAQLVSGRACGVKHLKIFCVSLHIVATLQVEQLKVNSINMLVFVLKMAHCSTTAKKKCLLCSPYSPFSFCVCTV